MLKKILKNKQIRDVISILGFPNLEPLLKNNYTLYHNIIEKKYPEPITIDEEFKYEEDGEEKIIPAGVDLDLEQIKIIVQDGLSKLLQKTRYEKIILMADPDVDGAHINILFITFIFCNMPHLIEGGRLFVAVPPLYRIQSGSKVTFIYSEDELEKFRQEEKKETRDIERIKGLGQMSPEEL